jgi:hypothetical protein
LRKSSATSNVASPARKTEPIAAPVATFTGKFTSPPLPASAALSSFSSSGLSLEHIRW